MPPMVDRRRLVAFWLARALDVEPGEDEAAAAAEEGVGVGSDSDMKDLLNSGLKVAGDGDGQRKGGVVLAFFDGVDALSGDTQGGSELGLGEASSLAQTAHVIIHEPHHPRSGETTHSCRSRVPDGTQSRGQPRDTDDGHADHGGAYEVNDQQKWSGGEMTGRREHEAHHDAGGEGADETGLLPAELLEELGRLLGTDLGQMASRVPVDEQVEDDPGDDATDHPGNEGDSGGGRRRGGQDRRSGDGGEHGDHPLISQSPRERVSCLLDMSSVLDRADHVKRASLEESGPPTLINKKFRIDAAPGRWGQVVDAPLVGGVFCVWDLV